MIERRAICCNSNWARTSTMCFIHWLSCCTENTNPNCIERFLRAGIMLLVWALTPSIDFLISLIRCETCLYVSAALCHSGVLGFVEDRASLRYFWAVTSLLRVLAVPAKSTAPVSVVFLLLFAARHISACFLYSCWRFRSSSFWIAVLRRSAFSFSDAAHLSRSTSACFTFISPLFSVFA